jgi:hypothetical protein
LFLRPETLPQKAGCSLDQLGSVVLKEVVDNALDTSPEVELESIAGGYRIVDRGPGIDPAEVPRLFAVNRPLLSSKLKRLPLRGMLGNGLRVVMGAVAAFGGQISVTTRGHRLSLAVDTATGMTKVLTDEPVPFQPGTIVEISLSLFDGSERRAADLPLVVAQTGQQYSGPSHPAWYGVDDLRELFTRVTPDTVTVGALVRDVFSIEIDDQRRARDLTAAEIASLYSDLRSASTDKIPSIGHVGNSAGEHYGRADGIAQIGGAEIPYCVEAWVGCEHVGKDDSTTGEVELLVNRSVAIVPLRYSADSYGISLTGCGLDVWIRSGKRAAYDIVISLITPYAKLMNDGKMPFLGDFRDPVIRSVQKAAGAAYRAMTRPQRSLSIKDAAWQVMEEAYLEASDNGTLPANARQIMYAARPLILKLTGLEKFTDSYFTQTLLPDYVAENPEQCADWDVVFDDRGHFTEPHTGRAVPLGTIEVREYLGERPAIGPAVMLSADAMYPTIGPEHRFRTVLYVEKEGFDPLLQQARIGARFDVAIMSTKGMSVVAARKLLDRLVPKIDRLFALHDFDVSGFSIAGTLTSDGRRYVYENEVNMVDLGLRLADVQAMGLQPEPVKIEGDRQKRVETLLRHGATWAEIRFLLGPPDGDGGAKRVELNAMTSRQFVDFIERKLIEHDVEKVVPKADIIEQHARRLVEQGLAKEALDQIRDRLAEKATAHELPRDLNKQIRLMLKRQPELSWDMALAIILKGGD